MQVKSVELQNIHMITAKVDKENNEKDLSSLSSSVDERKVSRSKMIKYVLMGGLLLGAVVAIILGSMYVVHLRTMSNNQSDNLQALGLSLGTSHPTSRPTPVLRAPTAIPTRVRAAPTAIPTRVRAAPTTIPTRVRAAPTAIPTRVRAAPTAMPTFPMNGNYCPSYSTSNTNSDTTNYAVCPITACPGDTVTMTTFAPGSCNGDTYLRLYDQYGNQLASDDDFYGSGCSQITYTFSASCRTYELREGCYGSTSCGGQIYYFGSSAVSQSPIAIVTAVPTGVRAAPTSLPSHVIFSPTAMPIFPTNGNYCPSYSASNTNSDTTNYAVCPITACPGDTVTMTTSAPGSCNGDTYLRLYDPFTGEQLASDDDYNGSRCSQITYTFTASCRPYELREGCYGSDSCGGRIYYSTSSVFSQAPIAIPTTMPTGVIAAPTVLPTGVIAAPSALPTGVLAAPTVLPTQVISIPTSLPTGVLAVPSLMPTYRVAAPTVLPTPIVATPTALPTVVVAAPTAMPTFAPYGMYCPSYSTSNTNSDTTNYAVCPITACPGETVTMTTIAPGSCNGDTYLRLYDPSTGEQLASDDDYNGSSCSQITYTFSASCRTYELREGCWSSTSCGGRIYYFGSSTVSQFPVVASTQAPSLGPTNPASYCPMYSASNTNSDTTNYSICSISVCPGDTVTMTTFAPGSCNGDTYLRLYDPSTGAQLSSNDDYNGSGCSQITYTFSASCRTYELREGCWSSTSCGGRIYYFGSSAVSQSPIAIPTTIPTGVLADPTVLPTRVIAVSRTPTTRPSYRSSTSAPTSDPSDPPTVDPTSRPTTANPSSFLTTLIPSSSPTLQPSSRPLSSSTPTSYPTVFRTRGPTISVTKKPTTRPSSRFPTLSPTLDPSDARSRKPTTSPTSTRKPSSRAPVKITPAPSRRQSYTSVYPSSTPSLYRKNSPTIKPSPVPSRKQSRASFV